MYIWFNLTPTWIYSDRGAYLLLVVSNEAGEEDRAKGIRISSEFSKSQSPGEILKFRTLETAGSAYICTNSPKNLLNFVLQISNLPNLR